MHATIERYMRNREINVPADYVEVCKNARKKPYIVKYLDHTFFRDFTKPIIYKSITPGSKKGDPIVTDIRYLKYTADGNIYYKLNYSDEYEELPRAASNRNDPGSAVRKSSRKSRTAENHVQEPVSKAPSSTGVIREAVFRNLYSTQLMIDGGKFKHLQELKTTIPKDYHSFYDNLKFS